MPATPNNLLETPLHALHLELGARMVAFAGYEMPVQYPAGLMAEHFHTRNAASLFDVSHMGQLRLVGAEAAAAFETLMPVDVIDLPVGKQRYGLLLDDSGGIMDDLLFCNRQIKGSRDSREIFIVVNSASKAADFAHLTSCIGERCGVVAMPGLALLALQGPMAVGALQAFAADPVGIGQLVFMSGEHFSIAGCDCFITRSGYTGEDGFEISVAADQVVTLARALLAQPAVKPAGLGARNSLRLEAGLCLYGHDIDTGTTPAEASLNWAIPKIRRTAGARAGGFPGADKVLAQLDRPTGLAKKRVGLLALERTPVRDGTALHSVDGRWIGKVTSGLLGPSLNQPVAMGYLPPDLAVIGTRVDALVRGKPVPMQVSAMPFVPNRYYRSQV